MRFYTKHAILYFLITLCVIAMAINSYLCMDKNTIAQPYLTAIYQNNQKLRQKYKNLINPNLNVKQQNSIYIVENFLEPEYFKRIKSIVNSQTFTSRNLGLGLKKGDAINFTKMHENRDYYDVLALYYSNELTDAFSSILKKPIQRTPLSDLNAESIIAYVDEKDNINWHFDQSNYYGDRYVALITLVNENADKNGLSVAKFEYKIDGQTHSIQQKENSIMIFKGSEIKHRGTSIDKNEKRVLLSMVLCDICQERKDILSNVVEKIKNFVNYG